jgi:magnesium-transporting ATPase (P-type)
MEKQNHIQPNFSLQGYSSILIGIYFLCATFLIKKLIMGFLVDGNPLGALSPQIIEILILTIIFITFIFSSLTLFFNGKSKSKKLDYKLWNAKTKTILWKYLLSFIVIFLVLSYLIFFNYSDYLAPFFLLLYAVTLLFLKLKNSKNLFILAGVSLFLAIICFLIPNYWYSSLLILGIAHITYGLVVKD